RAGLANQTNHLAIGDIVFIKFASGEKWNAPRLKIIRSDVVTRSGRSFVDRWNVTIAASVKGAITSGQRNITAHRRALQTRNITQRIKQLLDENLARRSIGILRNR